MAVAGDVEYIIYNILSHLHISLCRYGSVYTLQAKVKRHHTPTDVKTLPQVTSEDSLKSGASTHGPDQSVELFMHKCLHIMLLRVECMFTLPCM